MLDFLRSEGIDEEMISRIEDFITAVRFGAKR